MQQPRLACFLELLPHVADVHRDHVVALRLSVPDRIQQLLAGEHLARMAQEVLEQSELRLGQRQRPFSTPGAATRRFEDEVGEAQMVRGRGAAKEGTHAREQLS